MENDFKIKIYDKVHNFSELFRKGMKFTFGSYTAEVVNIESSTYDVLLTESQGFSRVEKGWSIEALMHCIKIELYKVIDPQEPTIPFL